MLSKAKKRSNKKWNQKHKQQMKIYRYRSAWRHFFKYDATLEDLKDGKRLSEQRKRYLLK